MTFTATIERNGKTATGIQVPDDVVTGLGGGRRPAVRVTIGHHTYRTTVGSMGGRSMLPLSAEHRTAAGVAAGDEVHVELSLDEAPRELSVPQDLAAAIAGDPTAQRFFDGLSYSNKRWYVLWVDGAKKAETRDKRVAGAVVRLREGRVQR